MPHCDTIFIIFVHKNFPCQCFHCSAASYEVTMGVEELCDSAQCGELSVVKDELDQGTDVDSMDRHGMTALMHAAFFGCVPVVEYLLSQGASTDRRGVLGRTPLHWAVEGGSEGAVRALLQREADPNMCDDSDSTPLHWAGMCDSNCVTLYNTLTAKAVQYSHPMTLQLNSLSLR